MTGIKGVASPGGYRTHVRIDQQWVAHAACLNHDPELWFDVPSHETAHRSAFEGRGEKARAICAGCPVVGECLAYAIAAGERYGIWGGLDYRQRQALGQQNRPRKGGQRRIYA